MEEETIKERRSDLTSGQLNQLINDSDSVLHSTLKEIDGKLWAYPSPGLYPGAWNWDTPQIAAGLFHSDKEKAVTLLEDFLTMQWKDGMIPHIVFPQLKPGERLDSELYFPPPHIWYIKDDKIQDYAKVESSVYENHPAYKATGGRTTGITQYPIWSINLEEMYDYEQQHEPDPKQRTLTPDRLAGLVEKINKSHEWFHDKRDPLGLGIVAEFHPWMGCDNAPCYDRAMARVSADTALDELAMIKGQRRDLKAIIASNGDISERPTDMDYAAYLKIAHRLARFTEKEMNRENVIIDDIPFVVYSPMLTGMLIRAERDLAELAKSAEKYDIEKAARERADNMSMSMIEHLWSKEDGQFCYLDAKVTRKERDDAIKSTENKRNFVEVNGALVEKDPVKFVGTCFPLMDETLPVAVRAIVENKLQREYVDGFGYGIATTSKDNLVRVTGKSGHEPRYWRGPSWDNVTKMLSPYTNCCNDLRDITLKLALENGFREYTDPQTGNGLGGHQFGWTAAAVREGAEKKLHELEAGTEVKITS